ncbi:MAG: hypothetical protein ACOCP8_01875 [archaeon]
MEFSIDISFDGDYFIEIKDYYYNDDEIAHELNIDLNKYREKGLKYNGYIDEIMEELFFKNKEDANKFIEYLTSYIIISKLSNVRMENKYGEC